MIGHPASQTTPAANPTYWTPPTSAQVPPQAYAPPADMREIGSTAVERLTSAGLVEFRQMLIDARQQRQVVTKDLAEARQEQSKRNDELIRRKRSWFRRFYQKRISELEQMLPNLAVEVEHLEEWLEATYIGVEFQSDEPAQRTYASLVRAFEAMRGCKIIWDVTADRGTNRVVERTLASRTVDRREVTLDYAKSDIIRFSGQALRFANANGEDILIYPGMIVMERPDGAFALVDLRHVQIECVDVPFVESEHVPEDAKVVGQTWAKSNKDGSPDRRFSNNYQIPVCLYGRLTMSSPSGLEEEYQFSNASAALVFGQAFKAYKGALDRIPTGTDSRESSAR